MTSKTAHRVRAIAASVLATAGLSVLTAGHAGAADPGVIQLGDLNPPPTATSQGAPIDPCSTDMWQGVPPQLRPNPLRTPRNVPPDEPSSAPYVLCVLENGGSVGIKTGTDGNVTSSTTETLSIYIGWGEPLGALSGAQGTTFAGRPGLLKRDTDPKGRDRCSTRVPLSRGDAGVIVLNPRFPDVDVCTIATSVSNHIATVAR